MISTPILDFAERYAASGTLRLHMPGHKGKPILGCEALDLTEIQGTEKLIEDSERNAAAVFLSGKTLYSAEGSSLCIRAMVYLALLARPGAPIVAARNVHAAFVSAAALCGAEIVWLWPETRSSLCECLIAPEALEAVLASLPAPPAAVYVTSPDYLGNLADIPALAAVCRKHDTPLLVDNAHGAYLKFLPHSLHPLDQGAAMCCDSAHKTLPVLTGGAYLHIAKDAPAEFSANGARAMALFASTSPSWLILASLDRCNALLCGDYPARLAKAAAALERLRQRLRERGWELSGSDPLRLTLRGDGFAIAARLRRSGVEPEYADRDFCVLMATPENPPGSGEYLAAVLGEAPPAAPPLPSLPAGRCERVCSPREALFVPWETVPLRDALGRVCAAAALSCPPAVPAVISGERIGPEALALLDYYGTEQVAVLKSLDNPGGSS